MGGSSASQIQRWRAEIQGVTDVEAGLAANYSTAQKLSYDNYNGCHQAWEHAWDASSDNGETDHSADGVAMGGLLGELSQGQANLQDLCSRTLTGASWSQAELARLRRELGAADSSPPALGQALQYLTRAQAQQAAIGFDPTGLLNENQAHLAAAGPEAGAVAADAPGLDVSGAAKSAMAQLSAAQYGYGRLGNSSMSAGLAQLEVTRSCRQALQCLNSVANPSVGLAATVTIRQQAGNVIHSMPSCSPSILIGE